MDSAEDGPGPSRKPRRGKRIVSEHLSRVFAQMSRNLGQEDIAKFFKLLLSNATDPRELTLVGRIFPRHLAQRNIREDNVGRNRSLICQSFAQLPQSFK